jgi:predicted AlkP superfamily pyrophosphatase or phosphodiesterase
VQSRDYRVRVGGLLLVATMATALPATAGPSTYSYRPQVVIISIDGLRPDAISDATTPTIMGIARRGAHTLKAETVTPSETTPSHASMLSGYLPKTHRLTWDGWYPERGMISVPTLLSTARQAGFQTTMIVGKQKLQHMAPEGGRFIPMPANDDMIVNEAMVWAGAGFDILVIHLPEVDLVGHSKTWMSPEYMARVAATDRAVARLLPAIPFSATIIITADHGGMGLDHGTEREQNMRIPWIITGPTIAGGKVLTGPVKTMDTAATAARILGLILPADIAGRAQTDAMMPAPAYQQDVLIDPRDEQNGYLVPRR